jgi:hypothetical protein
MTPGASKVEIEVTSVGVLVERVLTRSLNTRLDTLSWVSGLDPDAVRPSVRSFESLEDDPAAAGRFPRIFFHCIHHYQPKINMQPKFDSEGGRTCHSEPAYFWGAQEVHDTGEEVQRSASTFSRLEMVSLEAWRRTIILGEAQWRGHSE